LDKYYRSKIRR